LLIPLTATYSFVLWQRHLAVAEQVKAMSGDAGAEAMWTLNEQLPVVFGSGSVLGFVDSPGRWTGSPSSTSR
jgi:cell division protease FtsH